MDTPTLINAEAVEKYVEPPAVRAEDKRAVELEELRQKNLAKTMILGQQLDGKGQPIDKEGFYQQQKYQSEQIKQQQMDAAQNLHSYRNANVTTIDEIKSNTKKKEQEAAAMLHNYRGKPEAVLSHQVKKISTMGPRENLTVHGFTPASPSEPGTNFGDARNVFNGIPKDNAGTINGNSGGGSPPRDEKQSVLQTSDDVDDFFASLDDEFMPSPPEKRKSDASSNDEAQNITANIEALVQDLDYDDNYGEQGNIMKKSSESSNENSTESTGWVVLKEDQEQNANANASLDDFTKNDCVGDETAVNVTPAPQSVDDAPREYPPSAKPLPTWTVEYVSASFGLLTDANDAPPVGEGIGNHLLTNMVQNMQTVVQSALQGYIDGGVVQLLNSRYELLVARDATFVPNRDRPFVVKSEIKMNIPLNLSSSCDVPAVAMAVRMALKNALPRMHA